MPEPEKPSEEKKDDKKEELYPLDVDTAPVVTEHSIDTPSGPLEYTVTAGMLPLKSPTGEVEAGIFFMAYTAKGEGESGSAEERKSGRTEDREGGRTEERKSGRTEERGSEGKSSGSSDLPLVHSSALTKRPLMFSFNGGPGSSSVWLHLGAVGPKRVKMLADGGMPKPPFELEDNPDTWLADTDLVFIDPVGTGYSRPAKKELAEKFYGLKGDIESVGEFIRLYLTKYQRWTSPLFLVGESYGTTRAAGLSGHLIEHGVAFNGIVLISSILNFQTARFSKGNDLPYVLFLPTYTATAWYHKKLPKDLQGDLRKALREAEEFAGGEYTLALARGDALTAKDRGRIARKLARLTGLSPKYVDQADLRIQIQRFCKELLRDERRTVGRLDSRFKGIDASGVTELPDFDPSMAAIRPPYTAMLNDYVRRELGYENDAPYHILGGEEKLWEKWDWGSAGEGHPDTSEALRSAFAKNPYLKLFVASGYFDMATPYFATYYTLAHMGLDPSLKDSVTTGEYEAGHMMYIHEPSLAKLRADVAKFISRALS